MEAVKNNLIELLQWIGDEPFRLIAASTIIFLIMAFSFFKSEHAYVKFAISIVIASFIVFMIYFFSAADDKNEAGDADNSLPDILSTRIFINKNIREVTAGTVSFKDLLEGAKHPDVGRGYEKMAVNVTNCKALIDGSTEPHSKPVLQEFAIDFAKLDVLDSNQTLSRILLSFHNDVIQDDYLLKKDAEGYLYKDYEIGWSTNSVSIPAKSGADSEAIEQLFNAFIHMGRLCGVTISEGAFD